MKTPTLLIALSLAFAASAASAQPVGSAADATARLQAAGYADVRDLEYDDGLWEAEVRHADGRWHDVALDPATGELMDDRGDRGLMTAGDVIARLQAAGFTEVRDLDLDDAVWEADARGSDGRRVELRINAHSGRVISEEIDD
ncbi:PepSY domain-containing protein [Arenimonas metalli]|uniref:PepSY domain-containing protein n=1 Tax=Arenimonas metalli CF5-1 TaxID=1384056 RepID=A0A091BB48_9GAMM|nr:PepSY domain-containing protein [Arenimonas metalli]KFN48049.1 hypothetical protein N787_06325 [Arenimonas metalli CF5-1]